MLKRTVLVLSFSSFLLTACGSSTKEWHLSDQEAYQYGYELGKAAICLGNSKEFEKEANKLKDPSSIDRLMFAIKRDIMNYTLSKARGKDENLGALAVGVSESPTLRAPHINSFIQKGYSDGRAQKIPRKDCSHINYGEYLNQISQYIQYEKEEKARKEFYATPQGQAYLAQERLANQQQQQTLQMMQMIQSSQPKQNPLSELNKSLEKLNQTVDKYRTRVTNCYGGSYGNSATCYTN